MADDPKLTAEMRSKLGSTEARRLRRRQLVPGNVYGHGEGPQAIAVAEDVLEPIINSGHKVVDLELGGSTQKAMLREVQWDTFGIHLLHFDLQRVSEGERVLTEVVVHTHGTAPGVVAGGILELALHSLHVDAPATQIPDAIEIKISNLQLGESVHVRDLQLPPGVKVTNNPDEIVVHIVAPTAQPAAEESAPTEPEVITKAGEGEA